MKFQRYFYGLLAREASLVSTDVVCERLSVMHQPARLPENFDQILQNTPPPILEFGSRTPPSPEN